MNRQIVKLQRSQLRSLIKEAIEGREVGSPLFSPPTDRPVHMPAVGALVRSAAQTWTQKCSRHDGPVADCGPNELAEQVNAAAAELTERVRLAYADVERKLLAGKFDRS